MPCLELPLAQVQERPVPAFLNELVGKPVAAIDTPSLVINLDAMDRNLHVMKEFVTKNPHIKLRPHCKLHKSAWLAEQQITRGGASGVCVQKIGEAEALVLGSGGAINDIYISNQVIAPSKLARAVSLHQQLCASGGNGVSIAVDSEEGIKALVAAVSEFRAAKGLPVPPIPVLIEIEVGQKRCGVQPEQAVVLAEAIRRHQCPNDVNDPPMIVLRGIQAYQGWAQHVRSFEERREIVRRVTETACRTLSLLSAAGFPDNKNSSSPLLVTGAGTGTFALETGTHVFGEIQPGSYLVFDKDYRDNEKNDEQPDFEHALFIRSRVVSYEQDDHATVDAGHKSHAIDTGLPSVWGCPHLEFFNGGDEHGILRLASSNVSDADVKKNLPMLNDIVWLVPNHCDPTFNLHDFAIGVRGGLSEESGVVERIIAIDGRGCAT